MFPFGKISLKQLLILSNVINELSLLKIEFVKAKFRKQATNFKESVSMLVELHLLTIKNEYIIPTLEYNRFLKSIRRSESKVEPKFRELILIKLFDADYTLLQAVREFLQKFEFNGYQYEFVGTAREGRQYSGIRNFLIDLEFLEFDYENNKYFIKNKHLDDYKNFKIGKQIPYYQFLKNRKAKEDIGRTAELCIVKYEKRRLSRFADVARKVKHIAETDVTAGYDIESFIIKLKPKRSITPIFIEVKAVSPVDSKFYWSRNEIEKAKHSGSKYYLYLLPVKKAGEFELGSLRIYKDPYRKIYKNRSRWICSEELLSFCSKTMQK